MDPSRRFSPDASLAAAPAPGVRKPDLEPPPADAEPDEAAIEIFDDEGAGIAAKE